MKIVKLAGVFVVILAVVVGALYLSNLGGGESTMRSNKMGDALLKEQEAYLKEAKDKLSNEGWKTELYTETINRLTVNKSGLKDAYGALNSDFNDNALKVLHANTMAEFAKAGCSPAEINRYMAGLNELLNNYSNAQSEPAVAEMRGTKAIYDKALAFANKPVGLTPTYNRATNSFNDFASYRQGLLNERTALKGDQYFRNISNITAVNNALSSLDGKLSSAESQWRAGLAKAVIRAYPGAPGDEKTFDAYCNAKRTYERRFGSSAELNSYLAELDRKTFGG